MPKIYVFSTVMPSYSFYDVKPEGFHTDEVELTEDERVYLRNTEAAVEECQVMIRSKIEGGT